MELGRFMGSLHPALVHFPIVLLIISIAGELVAVAFGRRAPWAARLSRTNRGLLLLGTVSALFAFVCGNFAEVWAARSGISQDAMEFHELLATYTSWLFVGLTAWRLSMRDDGARPTARVWRVTWVAGALGATVLLGVTAHYGAMLVYGHGAAVRDLALRGVPTDEDLATLAQKQDAASIFYSNQMHHLFGWLVLTLSALLLVDRVAPRYGSTLRRLGPLLLLTGGMFLMIFSDQDAWPLYRVHPLRPITDKEVLLHKTYALLMLVVGASGLWAARRYTSSASSPASAELKNSGDAADAPGNGAPSRPRAPVSALSSRLFDPLAGPEAQVARRQLSNASASCGVGAERRAALTGVARRWAAADGAGPVPTQDCVLPPSSTRNRSTHGPGEAAARRPDHLTTRRRWTDRQCATRNSQPSSHRDRVMALFALVGGALLFTHVHSAAPYANTAVGVYIHHTVMGCIALLIGAVKLAEDWTRKPARWLGYAFPTLMACEAVLLVNYNEGLPWFLGYSRHAAAAPHGGLVAPLGPYRAELVYDPASTRMQIYVLRRDGSEPIRLPLSRLAAVVRVGAEPTEMALPANPGADPLNAHFAANATFLRGAPLFQAQVHALIDGRDEVADFEPWVDTTLTVHAAAGGVWYTCPMHPLEGSARPGACPICGMRLERVRPPRPAEELHDAPYSMQLATGAPAVRIVPGRPVSLRFALRHDGVLVPARALEIVHTRRLHLIIASHDLSFFDHVHPVEQPDGTFSLDYAFPHAGEFDLFADVTTADDGSQVFRLPVYVDGAPPPPVPLREGLADARLIGDYRVQLDASRLPLAAREEAALTFTLCRDGVPVTNLQPYLGAAGHCVGISADTLEYIHSHPAAAPGAPERGPAVTFHARFPKPGLYKVWGQFRHEGHVVAADFVLRVVN